MGFFDIFGRHKHPDDNDGRFSPLQIAALLSAIRLGDAPRHREEKGMDLPLSVRSALYAAGYGKRIWFGPSFIIPIKSDNSIGMEKVATFIAEARAIITEAHKAVQALAKQHFGDGALTDDQVRTIADAYDAAGELAAKAAVPGASDSATQTAAPGATPPTAAAADPAPGGT